MRFLLHNLAYFGFLAATALPAQEVWAAWLARLQDRGGPEAPWPRAWPGPGPWRT